MLLPAVALIAAFAVERLVHAVLLAIFYLMSRSDNPRKSIASLNVLTDTSKSLVNLASFLTSVAINICTTIASYIMSFVVLCIVCALLYILLQYSNDVLFSLSNAYNGQLAASLQIMVVWPLKILNMVFRALVPLWNAAWWLWKKVPTQVLLQTVTNDLGLVINFFEAVGEFCRACAYSVVGWVGSFRCCTVDDGFCNTNCMEAGSRFIDLMTPMAKLRLAVAWLVKWVHGWCNVLGGPLDLFSYPLMDINLAKFVHFGANSVLYLFVQLPAITTDRCKMFGGTIDCVPDFGPVFVLLTKSTYYLGLMIDNWLNILLLIIQATLGLQPPPCNTIPTMLADTNFRTTLFGHNSTLVVGMTELVFARTDGTSAQYFSFGQDWTTMLHPNAFPFSVSTKYGIAAVTHVDDFSHDQNGNDRMDLMGCNCYEESSGIKILCGVAMQTDQLSALSRTIDVQFQLPSTAVVIGTCSRIDIAVETMRWPQTRNTQSANPMTANEKVMADAAVWVKPRCSSESIDMVCVDSFKQAACFPYCMGLHIKGSGSQTIILHDANNWNEGVTMLDRDCALFETTDPNNIVASYAPPIVILKNNTFGLNAKPLADPYCLYNSLSYTFTNRTLQYKPHNSLNLQTQPFVFSGDLALTAVAGTMDANGNQIYSIQVQRVWGNQINEFTIIPHNQPIPASKPCNTPTDCANVDCNPSCKAAVPYSFNLNIVATTSDRFVYWIANPTLEPFYAMAYYCQNKDSTNILQISALSSYAGIRMWRLDPYVYCPLDPATNTHYCPTQQSSTTRLLSMLNFSGFNTDLCSQVFDVKAVSLDYINEYNLALVVLRTTLGNMNTVTMEPIIKEEAEYVTIWINPTTMEPKEGAMWTPEAPSVVMQDGMLCPSQRRMPNFGSLLASSINAFIFFVRMPLFVVTYLPVTADMRCPVETHGHSILQTCGVGLFSLDDMFSSLYKANSHFWQTFAIIANSFGPSAPQTFLNGVTMFGESQWTPIRPALVSSFLTVGNINAGYAISVLQNSIAGLPPGISMAQSISMNGVAVAQVYFRGFARMMTQILDKKHSIANVFWNAVADGIVDWETIVLMRMRRSCGGLALMFGYSTPLGMMISRWCNAHVDWVQAGPVMASVFFVDMPLMSCVCIGSAGQSFDNHVVSECFNNAPDSSKPMLIALMNSNAAYCPALVEMTKTHFTEALDPMFANLEAGARHLGSVIDWMIGDDGSGQCDNYEKNPFVVTIMPQPIDYWRVCGKTQRCRYLCYDEFVAFESVRQDFTVTETVTTQVQSLFFNSKDQDTNIPVSAKALMEISNCSVPCGNAETDDRCFVLVGEKLGLQKIFYCVPAQLNNNIRRTTEPIAIGSVSNAFQIQIVFVPQDEGFYNGFKVLAATKDAIYSCDAECTQLWSTADLAVKEILSMWVFGRQVVFNTITESGDLMQASQQVFCSTVSLYFSYPVPCLGNLWPRISVGTPICALDEFYLCNELVFVPHSQSGTLELCTRDNMQFSCDSITMSKSFVYNANLGLMAQSAVWSQRTWQVFAVNKDQSSHWLQMSKLSLVNEVATSSSQASLDINMEMNLLRQCSLDNCVGCTDLSVQRLCYSALQCQLARCVGTMIHERRPMCAIGMHMQSIVSQQLSFLEGSWLRISETMASVISITNGITPPTAVTWPDQAFYGFVCASKDMSATGIAIAVASINGIVQAIAEDPNLSVRQQWTNEARAQYTMVLTATTGFLNQLALYPLYGMIAVQKVFICNANSLISKVLPGKILIGDPNIQNYSSRAAGQCMTQYFAESTYGEGSGTDNVQALMKGAVNNIRVRAIQAGLETLIHPIDVFFTWLQGCVSGIQDIIQAADPLNCKLPNFAVTDSFRCACHDDAFAIVSVRAAETWQSHAFWCSTAMSMLESDGSTRIVWNPYSLQQLKAKLSKTLDKYLQCMASSNQCDMPSDPIFDQQQVSMISVYQRCLSNYQAKQWDEGTWVLFNESARSMLPSNMPSAATMTNLLALDLHGCLQQSHEAGSDNSPCLNMYLQYRNMNALDYFEYTASDGTSVSTDACESFTGPAKYPQGQRFRDCLDSYESTSMCKLPGILWSGRSQNKIPVANVHSTKIQDAVALQTAANNAYAVIHSTVQQALDAMKTWTASSLNVAIFSAEGDILHQYFDCLMMGALGHTDLWPAPDSLPKPIWSRHTDGSGDRTFELPCNGDQLKDRTGARDNQSPFTCGSYPRRAAIKYFIRSRQSSAQQLEANRAIVETAVKELLGNLSEAWGNKNNYLCQCADGTRGFGCCTLPSSCDPSTKCACADGSPDAFACCVCDGGSLLPSVLQIPFTTVPGSQIVDGLLDEAAQYMSSTVFTSNLPWLQWDPTALSYYDWSDTTTAQDYMIFDTTQPVKTYSEIATPFKTTIWEQCHGLLEQIYYTMPVNLQNRPTTLDREYDPDGVSQTVNLTYREEFIQQLVHDAYLKSPTYWQYNMRHKPSESKICKNRPSVKSLNITKFVNGTKITIHGYNSWTLGAYEKDCYCGWYNGAQCQIPPAICDDMVQLVSTDEIISICNGGGFTSTPVIEKYIDMLTKIKGTFDYQCMQFDVSDLWGIMDENHLTGSIDTSNVWQKILVNGTSGLRVGSLNWVASNKPIDPTQRINKLENVPQDCDVSPSDIANHFVDELFPAIQGVRQNVALNACLRHTIELARLYAFRKFGLTLSEAEQLTLVNSWRAKCEQKLEQVAFCATFGVYDIMIDPGHQCPFTVDPAYATFNMYSITPTCLIVFRPDPAVFGSVYDPCQCGLCNTNTPINLFAMQDCGSLTNPTCRTSCKIMHVRDLIIDNNLPVYPARSDTSVPLPWARTFNNPAATNSRGQWDTVEGNTTTIYCDMVVDWWPDEWLHPVGYHVTFPCSEGVPRTFDSAWAYVKEGDQVWLQHANLANTTKYQNEYGGAGPCRTHNYGMPAHTINTIRVCTQADNQPYDATVPAPPFGSPQWNDEYCSSSPYEVPWSNGPTSVGMLMDKLVDIVASADYDPAYRTCKNDSECCSSCKCFIGVNTTGVCVVLEATKYECAQHKHCASGKMCAGEGVCVNAIMQLTNNMTTNITTRVFSDGCQGIDPWGVSKEEIVPDILQSSGLCSFRSWYEHRNLDAQCTADVCSTNGNATWKSTRSSPMSLFDKNILKVQAHACDRDYEHYVGLKSCQPSSLYMMNNINTLVPTIRGSFTQTYRRSLDLKMVRQPDLGNLGFGFSGTGRLYTAMGYKTASDPSTWTSIMKPCSSLLPCTLQSAAKMWYVNGVRENNRYVIVNGAERSYNLKDMAACGSMGYILDSTRCKLDVAVVPLYYVLCQQTPSASLCTTYSSGYYLQQTQAGKPNLQTLASQLNNLLTTMSQSPTDFGSYMDSVQLATTYWNSIQQLMASQHVYGTKTPQGLYYIMTYSAYEFPFAYWFRCGWLSKLTIGAAPIVCDAWDNRDFVNSTKRSVQYTEEPTYESPVALLKWLASLSGIYTRDMVQGLRNKLHEDMISAINAHKMDPVPWYCYGQASFHPQHLENNTQYQTMAKTVQGKPWSDRNVGICNNFATCFRHENRQNMYMQDIVADTKTTLKNTGPCAANKACYNITNVNSFAQDQIPSMLAADATALPMFMFSGSSDTVTPYDPRPNGCSLYTDCTLDESACDCGSSVPTAAEYMAKFISDPQPNTPAWATFYTNTVPTGMGNGPSYSDSQADAFDICNSHCGFANFVGSDNCDPSNNPKTQVLKNTYCGTTAYAGWTSDPQTSRCMYSINDDGSHRCLGKTIGSKKVNFPSTFVDLSVYSVSAIPCYRLTCDIPLQALSGTVVYSLAGLQGTMDIITDHIMVDWTQGTLQDKPAELKDIKLYASLSRVGTTGTYEKKIDITYTYGLGDVLEFSTDWSTIPFRTTIKSSKYNAKLTRMLSPAYSDQYMTANTTYLTADDLTFSQYTSIIRRTVQETEDRFNNDSRRAICQDASIASISTMCVYRDRGEASLIEAQPCSEAMRNTECRNVYWKWCQSNYDKDWGCRRQCAGDWDGRTCWGAKWENWCPSRSDQIEGCIASKQSGDCMKMKCNKYSYKYITLPACRGTEEQCSYSEKAQQELKAAGLPHAGFCPSCVTSGCPLTKSSYTYKQVSQTLKTFTIGPASMTSGQQLNDDAKYYSIAMKTGYQCGDITCPAKSHKAQVRKNLYTCVPCTVYPTPYCTGNHMCGFENSTFESVYNKVRTELEQLLAQRYAAITPEWADFLTYLPGYTYDPQPLQNLYNAMMEKVGGVCSATRDIPAFDQCQNDGLVRKLQTHYKAFYKIDDGYVVPPNNSLMWTVDGGQLLRTNIVSWAQTSSTKFISELLDQKVCTKATLESLVCFDTGSAFQILNPNTMGEFEVQEGCDVSNIDGSRIIDARCDNTVCNNRDTNDQYNTISGIDYTDLTKRTQCGLRHGQLSRFLTTRSSYDINLCSKTPSMPATCPQLQGMVGSGDGNPTPELYDYVAWPKSAVASGLFTNPVLQKRSASIGNITLNPTDIGGTFIRMVVTPSGKLVVQDIPLRSSFTSVSKVFWANSSQWITEYMQARDPATYSLLTCRSWSCPITRRHFWTGAGRKKPLVPDPQRTRVLYGTTLHPTTRQQTNAWLLPYQTRNGFCVCVKGTACQPTSGPCSLAETTKSLYDFEYRLALAVQTPCALQSDWPYTGGTMRDESYLAPNTAGCGVLDRIPPYRYRYTNIKQYGAGTSTTLAEGSACHMGRPVQYSSAVDRCTLMTKTDSTFILDCNGTAVTLPRPKSNLTADKRLCNQCDKLPRYRTSTKAEVEPEVSYGQLWRWSPARLLARDLRFRLCGNATDCDAARDWTLNTFWPSLFSDIAHLFDVAPAAPESVWDTDWMLCTGKDAGTCKGKATKAQWLADRPGTCKNIRYQENANDAVASLNVCNLDSRLNNLCNIIQSARYKLFETNCQITGACRTSSFFYTPGTYNLINNEFVRDTVSYFYNYTEPGSCPVLSEETARVISQNKQTSGDCASVDLEALQMALQFAREVVHIFVEIYFYVGKIQIEVISLLVGSDVTNMLNNVITDFKFIVEKFNYFFMQIADLGYKLVTETGQLGRFLKGMIVGICNFLNLVFDQAIRPAICGIRTGVLAVMWFVREVVGFFGASSAYDAVENARNAMMGSWSCDISNPFNCAPLDQISENSPSTLPVATRCWVGDQSVSASAGCRASDTCVNDDGSLVVCAACSNSVSMVRYGCNSLTKTCHCHTFPQDYSGCSTHQECYLPDTGCAYMDAFLQPGFGNVPCAACTTRPQCLISGGKGQCVCLLRPMSFQSCAIGGELIVPDATKLCLFSSTPSLSNAKYRANYNTLASIPCALINAAQSYCMQVFLSADTSALLTVGLSVLRSRRLFSIHAAAANFSIEPCKSIMATSDKRPLEIYLASECDKWYQIGEFAIAKYNLTNTNPASFTTALGLITTVINSDHMPTLLMHLLQYTELFGPVSRWIVNMTRVIEQRPLYRKIRQLQNRPLNHTKKIVLPLKPARRLLQTWKDSLASVQQYSIDIGAGREVSAPDASEWMRGPFTWPPTYNYWSTEYPCLAAQLLFNYTLTTMTTTVQFYTNSGPPRPPVSNTFIGSIPHIKTIPLKPRDTPFLLALINRIFDTNVIRSYVSSASGQPSQLSTDIRTMLSCNFEHVQHCTGKTRSLVWSAVIVLLALMILSVLLRSVGISGVDMVLVLVYVPLVLYLTYTYSIFCVPMVPTCVGDDIMELVHMLLPVQWLWPQVMQRWPGCIDGQPGTLPNFEAGTSDCILSCQEWPFNYNVWQHNAAWAWCNWVSCDPGQQWLSNWQIAYDFVAVYVPSFFLDILSPVPFVDALRAKAPYLELDDMKTAQWICWGATVVQFVPFILTVIVLVALLVCLVSVVVYCVQFVLNVFLSLFVFIHVH